MHNSFRAKKAEWRRIKGRYRVLRDTVAERLFNNILVAAERGLFTTSTDVALGKPSELTLWDFDRVQRLTDDLFDQIKASGLDLQCKIMRRGGKKGQRPLRAITIQAQMFGGSHYLRTADLSIVRKLYRGLREREAKPK